jgi:tetratricopeptide (TPR) repeat protein
MLFLWVNIENKLLSIALPASAFCPLANRPAHQAQYKIVATISTQPLSGSPKQNERLPMKSLLFPAIRAFVLCLMATTMASATPATPYDSLPQEKDAKAPQVSADEAKALTKIQTAPDAAAKLQAAGEFVKKYPKSLKRFEVAGFIAGEIGKADPTAQLALTQTFLSIFTDAKEANLVNLVLIDSYIRANKVDEAFKAGAAYLEKNPEDTAVLTQLGYAGIEQAKRNNTTYAHQSVTYATKAIALIEADKMPENYSAEAWAAFKKQWQPILYQSLGLVSYMSGNKEEAKAKFEKSVALNPHDPFTYAMLGSLANEEYQTLADRFKTMMAGPLKDETLKRANAKIDEVIDFYAHAVALSQGDTRYQGLHDQLLQDLTNYYKYRHNNSTDGLQALLDKYKKPAQ